MEHLNINTTSKANTIKKDCPIDLDTDIESVSKIIDEDHMCVDTSDIEMEFTHSLDDFSIDDIADLLN